MLSRLVRGRAVHVTAHGLDVGAVLEGLLEIAYGALDVFVAAKEERDDGLGWRGGGRPGREQRNKSARMLPPS